MTATHCCSALELRWKLRQLRHHYDVTPQLNVLPLSDPASGAMILEGVAATCNRDSERMQLTFGALDPLPDPRSVRLLLRHDPTRIVGTVQELYAHGHTLRIRARVEEEQARRMPAFSVGLRILQCELIDGDTPDFHGVLHRAEISEITLTDRPSDPAALVTNRLPAAFSDYHMNMTAFFQCANRMIQVLQQDAIRRHG